MNGRALGLGRRREGNAQYGKNIKGKTPPSFTKKVAPGTIEHKKTKALSTNIGSLCNLLKGHYST